MKQDLYDKQYFMKSRHFQRRKSRLKPFKDAVLRYSPHMVLDVGCGLGGLVSWLRESHIDAIGVDFARTLKDDFNLPNIILIDSATKLPFKDKTFDVVVSTDFFEHLDESEIAQVYKEMKRVGKIVLAHIAYEAKLNDRKLKYHSVNKPKEWWEKKLEGIILI
jgi:ubiquinone/menaquinone biosynthesis C-methylase UbiE